jgi:2-hydroxy-4-carboxymuconate semialdehyde hemiacetal dehydrogenase
MKVAVVGEGAIGRAHLDTLSAFPDVELALLVGGDPDATRDLARQRGIAAHTTILEVALADQTIDAVILCTPTPMHARQTELVLESGKHCLVEIPMADSLEQSKSVATTAAAFGRVAMVAHTRRFNRGHRWLREQFSRNQLHLQHLVVETFFFRRTNTNILGEHRTWTDDLLWHHACHSVDLFQYQSGLIAENAFGIAGPISPSLGIPMDLSVGLSAPNGTLLSLALSFNNTGKEGSTFRYICEEGTFIARYDELASSADAPVDLDEAGPATGMAAQDREFFDAINENREPNSSVSQCLPTMVTLDRLQTQMNYASKKS